MTRPTPERRDPDLRSDEYTLLTQFLDYHRATLVQKVSGLTAEQRAATLGPSSLTLAGLVHHLAVVEDGWFGRTLLGLPAAEWYADAPWDDDPDWEFTVAPGLDFDVVLDRYLEACENSRARIAGAYARDRLDAVGTSQRTGEQFSLRWILLHMIEETARHNGHADLLRESADGSTGE